MHSNIVMLGSTLKQGPLCPGERTATITCTAVGTDLIWLVDGRTMSYKANAQIGAVRSNVQSDQTSILVRVESRGDGSGVASCMSVLTISELPCHNGSTEVGEEISFWRRQAGKSLASIAADRARCYQQVSVPFCAFIGTLGTKVNTPKCSGTAARIQTAPDVDADLQSLTPLPPAVDPMGSPPPTLILLLFHWPSSVVDECGEHIMFKMS